MYIQLHPYIRVCICNKTYSNVSRQCKKDRATLKVDIKNVNLRL